MSSFGIYLLLLVGLLATSSTLGCAEHDHHHDHDHHQDHLSPEEHRELQGSPPWLEGWASIEDFHKGSGRCHTPDLPANERGRVDEAVRAWIAEKNKGKGRGPNRFDRQLQTISITTHFHIIHQDDGTYGGIPFDVAASMTVLNNAFAGSGFAFTLGSTTGPHRNTF